MHTKRWHDSWTLGDLLLRACERDADALAISFPDCRRTYSELFEGSMQAARSLAGLGVEAGAHVGILMPNCIDFVEVLLGASLIGAVVVPINARFKPRELAHVIADGDIEVLLTSDVIEEHADYVALLHETVSGLEAAPEALRLELPHLPRLRTVVLLGKRGAAGMLDREQFAAQGEPVSEEEVDLRRSRVAMRQVALMMFTSGTTAMPKGCPLSHEALVRTAVIAGRTRFHMTSADRFWDPLPMFHMSAILPLIGVIDAGAAMLTMTHFDADVAMRVIEQEQATILFSTFPAITQALLNHPLYHPGRFKHVRIVNNVAPSDALAAAQKALGDAKLISAYGCTECAGVVCFNDPGETVEQRTTTCGPPFDGIEVEIRSLEDGTPAAVGQRGEIVVRGYCLFEGYYKDPELTSQRIDEDGWFHTGDIGAVDAQGRVTYLGRLKDMLKVGGENVAAVEIESMLCTHPAVAIAVVVGVPDPKYMEVPAAFIELKPGAHASEEEILEHSRRSIASFKVPRHIRFVQEWPMSATKVQKFRLAEQLAAELQREREAATAA